MSTERLLVSRNKREGHYWGYFPDGYEKGGHKRFPRKARYKYKKQKSICPCIMYNSELGDTLCP